MSTSLHYRVSQYKLVYTKGVPISTYLKLQGVPESTFLHYRVSQCQLLHTTECPNINLFILQGVQLSTYLHYSVPISTFLHYSVSQYKLIYRVTQFYLVYTSRCSDKHGSKLVAFNIITLKEMFNGSPCIL